MSWMAPLQIEHATATPADVERGVFRRPAPRGGRIRVIAPDAGPPGFELDAVHLTAAERTAGGAHHTVVHVVSGRVRIIAEGTVTELAARDTRLIAPGWAIVREPIGEATVVEIRYARAANVPRRGVAKRAEMTALRDRVPVRFVPALHDILSPHTLYPVIGSTTWGPGRFAVRGPAGLSIGLATTPRDTGPALHVHRYSTEMFVVLAGRFRITWGERGEHATVLDPLDAIVVPRGINRAFVAAGDGENWLLPIVVGAAREADDIVFLRDIEQRLLAAGPRLAVELLKLAGLRIGERAAAKFGPTEFPV